MNVQSITASAGLCLNACDAWEELTWITQQSPSS
jgi:hypothetical protein